MPPKPGDVEWVSKDIIRQIFNESQFVEKVQAGIFHARLKRNSHLSSPPPTEPYCTNSQIVMYYDENDAVVAIVHQYLRPNGTLGGSGKPDPKRLFIGGRIISVRSEETS